VLEPDEYVIELCRRIPSASDASLDAFIEAIDGYAAASSSFRAAAAVERWAILSADEWQAIADWSIRIAAPPSYGAYHAELQTLLATMARDRDELGSELLGASEPDVIWILAQRARALTLLEPLTFIAAAGELTGPQRRSFPLTRCKPVVLDTVPSLFLPSGPELENYVQQTCWLHQLIWELHETNFRSLTALPDEASTLAEFRVGFTDFALGVESAQLLMGLGLRAIDPPSDLDRFHEELFLNSVARLDAAFASEDAFAAASTSGALNDAVNALVLDFRAEAEALIAVRDTASDDLQLAIVTHESCGALSGVELAFYQELTG